MIKEYVTHKTVCDSCGEEKYEGAMLSSQISSWYRLFGEDLCYVCYHSIINTLISERYITEDDYKEVKKIFTRNTRLTCNPFGSGSTATFELCGGWKTNQHL